MNAATLLDQLARSGVDITVDGDDLVLSPGRLLNRKTVADVRVHKPEMLAELRRRSAMPQVSKGDHGVCNTCGEPQSRSDEAASGVVCPTCTEWRIEGCPGFAVLTTADVYAEERFGACLRCGASWMLHGSPKPETWFRASAHYIIKPAATTFVLSRAREIARGEV